MKRTLLLLPFYGKSFPMYFDYWLHSVASRKLDVLLVTDMSDSLSWVPHNVKPLKMTFDEVSELARKKLGIDVSLTNVRKFCDLKPMYGKIFEEYLTWYDYWAFGDADLVYGRDFDAFLETQCNGVYDVVGMRSKWISGAFCALKKNRTCIDLFMRASNWKEVATNPGHVAFDELSGEWYDQIEHGVMSIEDCAKVGDSFTSVVARSNDIRWYHEDVICESALGNGEIVRMDNGSLTINSRGIPIFHYVNAKKRWFFTYIPWHSQDYSITDTGFYDNNTKNVCRPMIASLRRISSVFRYGRYRVNRYLGRVMGRG